MNEEELSEEKPKEPTIKKIYNIFGLLQTIFVGFTIITSGLLGLFLFIIVIILKTQNSEIFIIAGKLVGKIVTLFIVITFLISLLFIIIGVALYVLYLLNKTDKTKKTFGKKFIIRGIVGFILSFIILFLGTIIATLFGIDLVYSSHLPRLDK